MLFNRNITEYKATEHFAGEKELKRHSSDSLASPSLQEALLIFSYPLSATKL